MLMSQLLLSAVLGSLITWALRTAGLIAGADVRTDDEIVDSSSLPDSTGPLVWCIETV